MFRRFVFFKCILWINTFTSCFDFFECNIFLGTLGARQKHIFISRRDILTDVTLHYQEDCILNERLYVTFVDEPADDFMGVIKDMFSSVWKAIREKFLTGENYSRFFVAPGYLCLVKEYVVFGRILESGFDLVGFVPIFLNQAQLFFIMTGVVPSIDLIFKGFYDCLAASEVDLFDFDEEFKSKLLDLFSSYEI